MRIASRPPLRRIMALDLMIRAGKYPNARSAAKQLEVNFRTIQRDFDFMRDSLKVPMAYSHRKRGYYYSNPHYALPLIQVTEGELLALFLAERALQQYRETPFAKDLATAFEKLTSALPEEVSIAI